MHYFFAVYALISSIFTFCADSSSVDKQKTPKEHSLDDTRLQSVFAGRLHGQNIATVLWPCINPKLSHIKILYSLSDTQPLIITAKLYCDLMRIAQGPWDSFNREILSREEVSFGMMKSKKQSDELFSYLDEGFDYHIIKAIPPYYKPLISWTSKQILGFPLPKECCEKIVSYIDMLPFYAPCEIFKAEAMIMLRYALFEYVTNNHRIEGYKEYYQFSPALNALW